MQPMTPEACGELLARHDYAIILPRNLIDNPLAATLTSTSLAPLGLRHPQDASALPSLVALKDAAAADTLARHLGNAHDDQLPPAAREVLFVASLIRVLPGTRPAQIADHLARHILLACHAKNERGLLRYYQADTFLHLRRILRPPQLASLYGPIAEWTFPFQGQWASFSPPALDAEKDIIPLYWNVDGPTLDKIKAIARINYALDLYQEKHDYPWPDIAAYDHDARIAGDALIDAGAAGLCEERDIMAFAMHAIEYGPHFHQHPEIRAILETLDGEGYQAVSSRISPDCWRQIALAG